MYCFGIHFVFFFLFKILSVVIIGSFTHLFFYSFSPPTFYLFFFFLIQELWICVYRIYNKNVYIYIIKELDVNNFLNPKNKECIIFSYFEFNFKESLFTTFHFIYRSVIDSLYTFHIYFNLLDTCTLTLGILHSRATL